MTYKERIEAIKSAARRHPEWTDREVSIMLDAAFADPDNEETDDNDF